ncbi:MAG: CDP-glycerol glycerophosphotransferase family protein [Fibrobacter sp.]|nr:CDP-glycerol glycerophosphotransferase family protein [Fibrobacter sp.]
MRSIKEKIRAACYRAFRVFPIKKNKIFFDNYFGRPYGCNPKYICEALHKTHPEYDLVWQVRKNCKIGFPDYVRTVPFDSPQAIFERVTSKVWVQNVRCRLTAKKRKGQFYIQTWHGAIGVKKCEGDAADKITPESLKMAHHDSPMIDVMISNSRFCTGVYKRAFWYDGPIAEIGYPRNDLMACPNQDIVDKVRSHFEIPPHKKIFFYAPTFRKDSNLWDTSSLDINRTLSAHEHKFGGEWVCLLRLHPWAAKACEGKITFNGRIINATHYPDIQELLASSNTMVTDYSSCIFDFLIQRKPAFMFAPDIKQYVEERGLLFDPFKLPFPCALDNDELERSILSFDETSFRSKTDAFFIEHALKDDGHASERVVQIIDDFIQGK